MGLTGALLPWFWGVLGAICFGLLVAAWPRLERRRWQATARAVQGLGFSTCCLLLAATLLNDQFLFYVSWSDLLHTGPVASRQFNRGDHKSGARVVLPPGLSARAVGVPPLPLPAHQEGKRLLHFTVLGNQSGVRTKVLVYLPANYDPNTTEPYPVIEAFHGYPGTAPGGFSAMSIGTSFDRAVSTGAIRPPIVVMPQINNPPGYDNECVDDPSGTGPDMDTFLGQDLPQWTVEHFAVATQRQAWATMGFSFGGWCAAMIPMRHPQVFGAGMSFMGYFTPEFTRGYQPFEPGSDAFNQYDLAYQAEHNPPPVSLFVMASRQDRLAWPPLREFVRHVKGPLDVHADILATGGHRVDTIPPVYPRMLDWLSHTMRGFTNHGVVLSATPTPTATSPHDG